jgi:hypothetical protein
MNRLLLFCLIVAFMLTVSGCTSDSSDADTGKEGKNTAATHCQEPENPYDEGSGHYAGFEWAVEHDASSCDGNSQSFNEGCEEYEEQLSAYEECTSKHH